MSEAAAEPRTPMRMPALAGEVGDFLDDVDVVGEAGLLEDVELVGEALLELGRDVVEAAVEAAETELGQVFVALAPFGHGRLRQELAVELEVEVACPWRRARCSR